MFRFEELIGTVVQNDIVIYKNSKLLALCSMLRYRFFISAGMLPYLLGSAVAYSSIKSLDIFFFLVGFLGVVLVLIAVEAFNEYFDSRMGSDRVFSDSQLKVSGYVLGLGIASLFLAFLIACYLTMAKGWPVMIFAILGFFTACFYVAPPIRWAYRGLGEIIIAISYGPLLIFWGLLSTDRKYQLKRGFCLLDFRAIYILSGYTQ